MFGDHMISLTLPQVTDGSVDVDLVLPLELGPHAPELLDCQR